LTTGMTTSFWESSATFKRCTAEKASFVLLNYIDLGLTVLATNLGMPELNPLTRLLINIPALLIVFKIAIPLLIAWLIPGKLLLPSIALLAIVAIWNIKELLVFLF
jgi:hypothetical protein